MQCRWKNCEGSERSKSVFMWESAARSTTALESYRDSLIRVLLLLLCLLLLLLCW